VTLAPVGRLTDGRRRCAALVEQITRVRRLTLAARPEQVRQARRYVAATLGPEHPCLYAATEVVSELATNAIVYGSAGEDATIKVRVRLLRRGRVRLVVIDRGGTGHTPGIRRPGGGEVNGRGLLIVNALACRWDWAPHRSGHKIRVLLDPSCPGPDALAAAAPVDLEDS
jgi:anti-sigma regulatory factor (Ser/Thr protein kinase)